MDQMDQMNSVLNYYKWLDDYQPFLTILNYIVFPDDEETQHSDFQTPAPSESNNNHPQQIFEQNTETQSTSASNLCVESEPPDDIGPVNCSPKGPNIINRGSALSISQQAVQPCLFRLAFQPLKKLAMKVLAKYGVLGEKFKSIISSILTKASTIKHLIRFFYYVQYIEKEIPGVYDSIFEEYQHLCQAEHLTDGPSKGKHQSQKNKRLGQILAHLKDFLTKKSFDLVQIWELGRKKKRSVGPQFQPVKHHHERMSTRRSTQTSETESVNYQQCKMLQKAHRDKSIVNRRQRFILLEEQLSSLKQEARIEIRKIRQEHRRSA